jgi:recombination protein RecT
MAEEGKNVPATVAKFTTIREAFNKHKDAIQMALPKHMDIGRMIRILNTACLTTPKLLECDVRTLVRAGIQCAQLGLEPDNLLGQAYLIPFYNTKKGGYDVQVIPGYKGLILLARRSGQVSDITAHIVYDKEPFTLEYGTEEKIKHTPLPPSKRGENKLGVYAKAIFKDGTIKTNWLWAEDVLRIRESSKTLYKMDYSSKPVKPVLDKEGKPVLNPESLWVKNENDMWIKTAIRYQAKFLPLSPEYQKAAAIDEAGDAGISQIDIILDDQDIIDITTEQASEATSDKVTELKEKLKTVKAEKSSAEPPTPVVSETTKEEVPGDHEKWGT